MPANARLFHYELNNFTKTENGTSPEPSSYGLGVLQKMKPFTASRVAILCDEKLVTILRDDKPEIPYPAMWEFPGGGREKNETPEQCAFREIYEELGVQIYEDDFLWKKEYPSDCEKKMVSYFFVATISPERLSRVRFGNEGKEWKTMSIEEFMTSERSIPKLRNKLSDYLREQDRQNQSVLTTPEAAPPTS